MDPRDLVRPTLQKTGLLAAAYSSDQNGTSADLEQWEGHMAIVTIGAPGITLDGSNYIRFFLEDSDDNSAFAAVPDSDIIIGDAAIVAADTGEVLRVDVAGEASKSYRFGYKGAKRYVRVRTDFVGTHGAATPLNIVHVLSHGRYTGKNQFAST